MTEHNQKTTFAQRLSQLIRERGWTQLEAAEKLGISQSLISRYLRGKREPFPRTIAHLAERLGVQLAELTGDRAIEKGRRESEILVARDVRHDLLYAPAMANLKRRWEKAPRDRGAIRHLVALLFCEDSSRILGWLDSP